MSRTVLLAMGDGEVDVDINRWFAHVGRKGRERVQAELALLLFPTTAYEEPRDDFCDTLSAAPPSHVARKEVIMIDSATIRLREYGYASADKMRKFLKIALFFSLVLLTTTSLASIVFLALPTPSYSADTSYDLGSSTILPTGYDSYALMVFCGLEWLKEYKLQDIKEFYADFKNFGESIGHNNLAVWFWTDKSIFQVDTKTGQDWCTALNLNPNASPYIIVTSFYPVLKSHFEVLENEMEKYYYSYAETYLMHAGEESFSKLQSALAQEPKEKPIGRAELSPEAQAIFAEISDLIRIMKANRIENPCVISKCVDADTLRLDPRSKLPAFYFAVKPADIATIGEKIDRISQLALNLRADEIKQLNHIFEALRPIRSLRVLPLRLSRASLAESKTEERLYAIEKLTDDMLDFPYYKLFAEKPRTDMPAAFREFESKRSGHGSTVRETFTNQAPEYRISTYLGILTEIFTEESQPEYFILRLGSINPRNAIKLLNILDQNIRRGKQLGKKMSYEVFKQTVLTFVQDNKDAILETAKTLSQFISSKSEAKGK